MISQKTLEHVKLQTFLFPYQTDLIFARICKETKLCRINGEILHNNSSQVADILHYTSPLLTAYDVMPATSDIAYFDTQFIYSCPDPYQNESYLFERRGPGQLPPSYNTVIEAQEEVQSRGATSYHLTDTILVVHCVILIRVS